ncbi:hypothetical protein HGRIS_010221 [Hohenbuehelia grisea]|uniref:Uncharacterized protein n=1 Tax=Hohenbuehelia grisea TaxID=104357 RepID=A0ABR3J455_9AGAR
MTCYICQCSHSNSPTIGLTGLLYRAEIEAAQPLKMFPPPIRILAGQRERPCASGAEQYPIALWSSSFTNGTFEDGQVDFRLFGKCWRIAMPVLEANEHLCAFVMPLERPTLSPLTALQYLNQPDFWSNTPFKLDTASTNPDLHTQDTCCGGAP